jgi:hypothetical protein
MSNRGACAGWLAIPLVLLAWTTPASAQFGIRGGVNLSKFVGEDAGSESVAGLNLGASIPLIKIGRLSIGPEVYYAKKGGEFDPRHGGELRVRAELHRGAAAGAPHDPTVGAAGDVRGWWPGIRLEPELRVLPRHRTRAKPRASAGSNSRASTRRWRAQTRASSSTPA